VSIKYKILFRACDRVDSVHHARRPFGLNKIDTIKVCFYSMYEALKDQNRSFTIIGDNLSKELLSFFERFHDVLIDNSSLGSAAKSLQKQIDLAVESNDEEWVYMCEDDYLHVPYAFKYLSELIQNKDEYLYTSGKRKNYMNHLIGDLSKVPLIIHTPDYPDRYDPSWKRLSFVFLSRYCHWRQISNTTHTFLLECRTIKQFEKYIRQSAEGPSDSKLSEKVYGRIFFKNRALCLSPICGLSTHMTEGVMTPFVDWQTIVQENIGQMKKKGLWFD